MSTDLLVGDDMPDGFDPEVYLVRQVLKQVDSLGLGRFESFMITIKPW